MIFGWKKEPRVIIREVKPLAYEMDIAFLKSLIVHKLEFYAHFEIKVRTSISKHNMSDRLIRPFLDKIVDDVLNSISDTYKKTISVYFTEDGLKDFIAETVIYSFYKNYTDFTKKGKSYRA